MVIAMTASNELCPACGASQYSHWTCVDEKYEILKCSGCGHGRAKATNGDVGMKYDDYGEYITMQNNSYFASRKKISIVKRLVFKILRFRLGEDARLLDYGGGAGFFVSAAIRCGLKNTFLLEPSKRFRQAAEKRVGIAHERIIASVGELDNIDFVSMLDVMEHIEPTQVGEILDELSASMKDGGLLFGFTPNFLSVSCRLLKGKDPVVSPPGHLGYFTCKSLDESLRSHSFEKVLVFTHGYNTNAIFRKRKNEPSWVERPTGWQVVLSFLIRGAEFLIDTVVSPIGMGYHIVFLYRLKKN